MAASELREMTWEEVRDLERGRLIAILPLGAIEAHGPHLPLDTDGTIAHEMAACGARRLDESGFECVVVPPIEYTAAGFAAGFPGTISLPGRLVTELIVEIARSLAAQGFAALVVANAHLDPAHLVSIRTAVERIRDEALLRAVFPDLTAKPWARRLGEEFRSGACHAGCYETSVILAARPGAVREDRRAALEPNPASLSTAIRGGLTTFEEAGGPQAYFGDPAAASAAEGETTIETLGAILQEAVEAVFEPPSPTATTKS